MYIQRDNENGEQSFRPAESRREGLEAPHDMPIADHSEDVFMSWEAPEFEVMERDHKWYLYTTLVLIAIISYAVITNSPVMAITFILIGVVGYIYINKEPKYLRFTISKKGIIAGREMYPFESLRSFWIFYEPHNVRIISLRTDSYLVPYVHIPIEDEDPVRIREILLEHIPEEEHEPGALETLGRLLKL